jgi:hypothetical protein
MSVDSTKIRASSFVTITTSGCHWRVNSPSRLLLIGWQDLEYTPSRALGIGPGIMNAQIRVLEKHQARADAGPADATAIAHVHREYGDSLYVHGKEPGNRESPLRGYFS